MTNCNKPNTILADPSDMFYFPISWDIGRRCNLDCSYCPATQHDNFSPHASLDDLKTTVTFVKNYINALKQYIRIDNFGLSFTGGEPTNNPNLLNFCKYTNDLIGSRIISISSNGVMSNKLAENLANTLKRIRISYHCETSKKIKEQVIDNIFTFKKIMGLQKFSVNVMFHVDYFEECVDLTNLLKQNGIVFVPRVIGGKPGKLSHVYSDEQMNFFEKFYNIKLRKGTKKTGREVLGRACCGRSTMILEFDNKIKKSTLIANTEFEDYYCFINMLWLHINQQTRELFYNETCKALLEKKRGSFGSFDEPDIVISKIHEYFSGSVEFIRCPNKLCNCGLCVPKSNSLVRANQIFNSLKQI